MAEGFKVILCDCPWRYDFSETKARRIENQYMTLPVDYLFGLDVRALSAKDAVIFFWAPPPKLPEAFQVLEAWGFEYKTNAIWDKEKIGMGYWLRGQHELLLVGTRGSIPEPPEEVQVSSVIRAPRGKHSAKPTIIYEIIERYFPGLK